MFRWFNPFRRTRKPSEPLRDWLERYFPGRFLLLQPDTGCTATGLRIAYIAERADTQVVTTLPWSPDAPDMGLSISEVERLIAVARRELADAKTIGALLYRDGLKEFYLGAFQSELNLLLFGAQEPGNSLSCLRTVEQAIRQWPGAAQYGLNIYRFKPQLYRDLDLDTYFQAYYWFLYKDRLFAECIAHLQVRDLSGGFDAEKLDQEWISGPPLK